MTPEEFTALLDTYGADLTRWPHVHRQSAQKLLQGSERARDAFAEAQMLDSVLKTPEPGLSPVRRQRLTDAILDNLPDEPATRRTAREPEARQKRADSGFGAAIVRPLTPLWVACLGFGMIVGVVLTLGHAPAPAPQSAEGGWVENMAFYGGL